jgi:5-methyltetrahydrofolate--homocysteine methyltransferase
VAQIKADQQAIRNAYEERHTPLVPYAEANAQAAPQRVAADYITYPELYRQMPAPEVPLAEVLPYVDWRMFLLFWGFKGETMQQLLVNPEAGRTLAEGKDYLAQAIREDTIRLDALVDMDYALRRGNDILLDDGTVLPMLRRQTADCLCLSDYFSEHHKQPIGWFTIVARPRHQATNEAERLMSHAICARLAEACAEWLQRRLYGQRHVLRAAFGYATCPDHSLKRIVFDLLDAEERLAVSLTDHYSIQPSTAVCGLFICHPDARYFPVGRIDEAQLADYCQRRGISLAEGEQLLSKYIQR